MTETVPQTKRRTAQKVSLAFGYFSFFMALVTAAAAAYIGNRDGTEDPVFAALAATIVFFVGAGVVLYVMGAANLPDLSISKDEQNS
jgi:hypothetical protein